MDYELLVAVVIVAGVFATAVFIWLAGLWQFNGTRVRTRLLYCLWLIAFFSSVLFLFGAVDFDAPFIVPAILTGVLAAIPFSWWSILWLRARLVQHVLWYEPKDVGRRRFIFVLVVVVAVHFVARYIEPDVMTYVVVALFISWLLSTLYQIAWITALEHRLGCKVIEHRSFPCGE